VSEVSSKLPPLRAADAALEDEARLRKDAQLRGVSSIPAMREAIGRAARALPTIGEVPRLKIRDARAFRRAAEQGLPFLVEGAARNWPLTGVTPMALREQYGDLPVRARVGDYIATAFAPDRAMQDMLLRDYLDVTEHWTGPLPPYVGNLELRALNRQCHWPTWFDKMGPARFWIGPAGTVTPLHCDFDDNIFAQLLGVKRITLAPPHHDEFLYVREASALLFGSPVDPEAPDYERYPLARQATIVDCLVHPGDLMYVPAGWYHQVRALSFSLSANRWARGVPLAVAHDPAVRAS
jgi:hypothetical protein